MIYGGNLIKLIQFVNTKSNVRMNVKKILKRAKSTLIEVGIIH